jgi:hypothetical protein
MWTVARNAENVYMEGIGQAHLAKSKLAAKLTERLIEKCVKGLWTLPHKIRRYLRSAKPTEPDTRPLGRMQNPDSQARYASYIVKFVCFYLRIPADEEVRILQHRQEQTSQQAQQTQQTQQAEITDSGGDMLYSNESTTGGSDAESDSSTQPRRRQCK